MRVYQSRGDEQEEEDDDERRKGRDEPHQRDLARKSSLRDRGSLRRIEKLRD